MLGTNPIRGPKKGDGSRLDVQEIFSTLQGEGPHTGKEAVFIRLGGCNLACAFCDTEFERFREMALAEMLAEVEAQAEGPLVVITGGEPLRQPIAPLCQMLIDRGYQVQIETNGTLWRELPEEVEIICSPKASGGHYHPLRDDVLAHIDALKFIVSADDSAYATIPDIGQKAYHIPVYLQPMDVGEAGANARNLEATLALAAQTGYAVSLQTHKLAGIP